MPSPSIMCGGSIHDPGARVLPDSFHDVAACTRPRRVSVTTSSHASSPSLMPTPAKPMPRPRRFVDATVSRDDDQLDSVFMALADPTRRAILARLSRGDATVGELAGPFDMSRPAISKHLNVLERAGLVLRLPDGRVNRCVLDAEPLNDASQWLDRYRRYWEGRLDVLTEFLETEES